MLELIYNSLKPFPQNRTWYFRIIRLPLPA